MCGKHRAKEARETLADAIDQFAGVVEVMPAPIPAISPGTRRLFAVAEIYRGAAATVPLARRRAT